MSTWNPPEGFDFQSAVQQLKDKLAALGPQYTAMSTAAKQGTVALTNYSDAVVLHAGGVDWDPKDHPRDPLTGEFIKALTGFIWGKTKSGSFGSKDKSVNVDMKPGDAVYKTKGGNLLVAHADGNFTYIALLGQHEGQAKEISADSPVVKNLKATGVLIAENPGVKVPAQNKAKAEQMLKHPAAFTATGSPTIKETPTHAMKTAKAKATKQLLSTSPGQSNYHPYEPSPVTGWHGPEGIDFKPGKTSYTAKQVQEYEIAHGMAPLVINEDGKTVKSGDWVEYNGKPYQITASPYGYPHVTAYKWVSTKQKAANLPQFMLLTADDLATLPLIKDPTGKPYVPLGQLGPLTEMPSPAGVVKHGALMAKAQTGAIPSTSTKYKKYIAAHWGQEILGPDDKPLIAGASNLILHSGDWVQIDEKPVQVSASPNKGFVGISKWVSTKKKVSGLTYDFPVSILEDALIIKDPTGLDYKPVSQGAATAEDVSQLLTQPKQVANIGQDLEAALPGDWTMVTYLDGKTEKFIKHADGNWGGELGGVVSTEGLLGLINYTAENQSPALKGPIPELVQMLLDNPQNGDIIQAGGAMNFTYVDVLGEWVSSASGDKYSKAGLTDLIENNKDWSTIEWTAKPSTQVLTLPKTSFIQHNAKYDADMFVHPVSGNTYVLGGSDQKVYQNPMEPNQFVITSSGHAPVFFTSDGEQVDNFTHVPASFKQVYPSLGTQLFPATSYVNEEMMNAAPEGSFILPGNKDFGFHGKITKKPSGFWQVSGVGEISASSVLPYLEQPYEFFYPEGVKPPWDEPPPPALGPVGATYAAVKATVLNMNDAPVGSKVELLGFATYVKQSSQHWVKEGGVNEPLAGFGGTSYAATTVLAQLQPYEGMLSYPEGVKPPWADWVKPGSHVLHDATPESVKATVTGDVVILKSKNMTNVYRRDGDLMVFGPGKNDSTTVGQVETAAHNGVWTADILYVNKGIVEFDMAHGVDAWHKFAKAAPAGTYATKHLPGGDPTWIKQADGKTWARFLAPKSGMETMASESFTTAGVSSITVQYPEVAGKIAQSGTATWNQLLEGLGTSLTVFFISPNQSEPPVQATKDASGVWHDLKGVAVDTEALKQQGYTLSLTVPESGTLINDQILSAEPGDTIVVYDGLGDHYFTVLYDGTVASELPTKNLEGVVGFLTAGGGTAKVLNHHGIVSSSAVAGAAQGTVFYLRKNGTDYGSYTKTPDGKYINETGSLTGFFTISAILNHAAKGEDGWEASWTPFPEVKKSPTIGHTGPVTQEDIKAMLPGDVLYAKSLTGTITAYKKMPAGDFVSMQTGNHGSEEKVLLGAASDKFTLAFDPKVLSGIMAEPSPEAQPEGPQQFVHPLSGATFDLKPGDVVYKHKKTPNTWVIERPGDPLPIHFFNQYGKEYLPKAKQKNLGHAYDTVNDWPGKTGGLDAPTALIGDTAFTQAETQAHLKKVPVKEVTKSFTMANGAEYTISPGQTAVAIHNAPGWGVAYAILDADGSHVFLYPSESPDKGYNVNAYPPDNYWNLTNAQIRSKALENGGEIVADYPLPTPAQTDISAYAPDNLEGFDANYFGISAWLGNRVDQIRQVLPVKHYWGASDYTIHPYMEMEGGIQWSGASAATKLQKFVDAYHDSSGEMAATLIQMRADFALDTEQKKDVSAKIRGLLTVHRMTTLARELLNPGSDWSEDKFAEEMAFAASKAAKPGTSITTDLRKTFVISELNDALVLHNKQRAFMKSLTGLDFDPYIADAETLSTYATKTDHPDAKYVPALEVEDQRKWVLGHLGAPGYATDEYHLLQQLKSAKVKVEVAALVESLKAEQSSVTSVTAPETPYVEGVLSKFDLYDSYDWTTSIGAGVHMVHTGPDEWQVSSTPKGKPSASMASNDALVATLVNSALKNGEQVKHSEIKAYGEKSVSDQGVTYLKSLEADLGFPPMSPQLGWQVDALKVWIESQGVPPQSVALMNSTSRQWFVWAYAIGDLSALEVFKGTAGNKAQIDVGDRALASAIMAEPWGEKFLNNSTDFTTEQAKEAGAWITQHFGYPSYFAVAHPREAILAAAEKLQPSTSGAPLTKPGWAEDDAWMLVTRSTPETDFTSLLGDDANTAISAVDSVLLASTKVAQNGLNSMLIPALPDHVKRLAMWAASTPSAPIKDQILKVIVAKAKHGDYLEDTTLVWISPDGQKFPLAPGASIFKSKHYNHYVILEPAKGTDLWPRKAWKWSLDGVTAYTWYEPDTDYSEVFTVPGRIDLGLAQQTHPEFTQTFWDAADLAESGKSMKYAWPESGPLLTATLKDSNVLSKKYPNLYAQHKILPENVRQAIAKMLTDEPSNAPTLAIMDFKAAKNYYAGMQTKGLFELGQPWMPFLSKAQTSPDDVINFWTHDAQQAYMDYFGVSKVNQISEHLNNLLHPPEAHVEVALRPFSELELTPTGESLGGMHTKYPYVDQDGNRWMAKTFQSDPAAAMRIEAETEAIKIGALFGFGVPAANNQKVTLPNGSKAYAYLQYLKPAKKDFVGVGPGDLTTSQLSQAMAHHILDWIVSNHDTHPGNLMIGADNRIFGIDLGQALKFFPDDKLAVDYMPPGNGAPVWYDEFYHAVQAGSLPKATVDEVTKFVLRTAQRISKDKDSEYREHLEAALVHRDNWPDKFPSKGKFIDALVERKHDVFDTFVQFYKDLYAQSPYEWTIDTDNLAPPSLDPHTYVAVTPDYVEDVQKAGVQGKALFFSGMDLNNGNMLFYTAKQQDGGTTLLGETKVLREGNDRLLEWFKKQTVENAPTVHTQQQSAPALSFPDHEKLPGNDEWFNALVSAAKNVTYHNNNSNTEYNVGKMQAADDVHKQMEMARATLEAWKTDHPDKPFKGKVGGGTVELVTMEQQGAWEQMLDKYEAYYQQIIEAKGTTNKVQPHLEQMYYKAGKAGIQEYAKIKEGIEWTDKLEKAPVGYVLSYGPKNKITLVKKSKTAWVKQLKSGGQGKTEYDTPAVIADVLSGEGPTTASLFEPSEPVSQASVMVGTKPVKVIYRHCSIPNASFDFDTGEVTFTSGTNTKWQFGNLYEVDFGDTVIEYRPWGPEAGVDITRQGDLLIRKKDWTGDTDSLDSALDLLRQMGLHLNPASEESMELFYWKHMYYTMRRRQGGSSGKWAKVHKIYQDGLAENLDPSVTEELALFRKAWAAVLGEEAVAHADWLPKFSRMRPQSLKGGADSASFTAGRPYWYRSDFTGSDLKNLISSPPSHGYHHEGDALKIAKSGGLLGSEERLRYFAGDASNGMSSDADFKYGSGSVVYTHQNYGSADVVLDPRVMRRTTNYAYTSDSYGGLFGSGVGNPSDDPSAGSMQEKSSPWDITESATISGGELMIRDGVSVLDDMVLLTLPSETARQAAIQHYKNLGITHTSSGIPIEDLFGTTHSALSKNLKKAWDRMLAEDAARAAELAAIYAGNGAAA